MHVAFEERLPTAGLGDPVHQPPRVGKPEHQQEALHPLCGEIDPDLCEVDLGIDAGHVVPGRIDQGRVPEVDLGHAMFLVRVAWRSDGRAMGGAGAAVDRPARQG
ncbi:hypothetical protein ACFW5S_12785 [Streptomyces olivaceus]|uniref:hypothetical protein n=1 Tax=Streptomyces olivaceus TaxID=47716 RepID=UPI0033A84029